MPTWLVRAAGIAITEGIGLTECGPDCFAMLTAVAAVAVVGVPDARWGEVGRAFVVPRYGATIDAEELQRWARASLAAYRVPKLVSANHALPTLGSGKVDRTALATLATLATLAIVAPGDAAS